MNKMNMLSLASVVLFAATPVMAAPTVAKASGSSGPVQAREINNRINLNTAQAPEVAKALKGVGLKRAEKIIAYREKHGPFKSFSDLTKVHGIGAKFIQRYLPHWRLKAVVS